MQEAAKINNLGNLELAPKREKLRPPDKRNKPRKFGTGPGAKRRVVQFQISSERLGLFYELFPVCDD